MQKIKDDDDKYRLTKGTRTLLYSIDSNYATFPRNPAHPSAVFPAEQYVALHCLYYKLILLLGTIPDYIIGRSGTVESFYLKDYVGQLAATF